MNIQLILSCFLLLRHNKIKLQDIYVLRGKFIIYSKVNNFCKQLLLMGKYEIKSQRGHFYISHKEAF